MDSSCFKRFVLLVVVAAVIQFIPADESNDRMDTVIGLMVNMANRMDQIESRVEDLARIDELTANKVTKLEDSVGIIHKEEDKIENQIEEMKSHNVQMEKEMTKVNTNVEITALLSGGLTKDGNGVWEDYKVVSAGLSAGWVFHGRGLRGKADTSINKTPTTFQQCMQFCDDKRSSDGKAWNGMEWRPDIGECQCYKNDTGHDAGYPMCMHFKKV